MPEYLVQWSIDVEADNPRAAAEWALDTMREPDSQATVFTVSDGVTSQLIDLDEEE